MIRSPHLLVALSGHGYGHLAQVAPVINALRQRLPALRLTVQGVIPEPVLRRRIDGPLQQVAEAVDVGMVMASAVEVVIEDSFAAYRAFHADWEDRLARQEALLARLAPDLVLADIPYLPLAAAARLGLPAVALCSLNWADIFFSYCSEEPDSAPLREIMVAAYNSAVVFLQPAPSMPMPDLVNTRPIGPIAVTGQDRRIELNTRLGLRGDERLVLIGLGGVDMRLPMENWSTIPGVRWLAPPEWRIRRADTVSWETLTDLPFADLVHSCDVLLTKPGYGSFTEAVCNATPVLYVERPDWPEEPWLTRWLEDNGNAVRITRQQLAGGELCSALDRLLAQPRRPALAPTGIGDAADCLESCLGKISVR